MMFKTKDNTNSGGESLCKSCKFNHPDTLNDYCRKDKEFYNNVGVCKDYEAEM